MIKNLKSVKITFCATIAFIRLAVKQHYLPFERTANFTVRLAYKV